MDTKKIYLTPEEAAEYLNVSVTTIYRYIEQEVNPLPSYKISSKNIRITLSELDEWINTMKNIEKIEGGEIKNA